MQGSTPPPTTNYGSDTRGCTYELLTKPEDVTRVETEPVRFKGSHLEAPINTAKCTGGSGSQQHIHQIVCLRSEFAGQVKIQIVRRCEHGHQCECQLLSNPKLKDNYELQQQLTKTEQKENGIPVRASLKRECRLTHSGREDVP